MKRSKPEGKPTNRHKRKKAPTASGNNNDSKKPAKKNQKEKDVIRTGKIGRFLSEKWPDELLVGNISTVSPDDAVVANLDCIARFLADYRAVTALQAQSQQRSNQQQGQATPQNDNNGDSLQRHSHSSMAYYLPSIETFANTQIDRQSAGLRTNTTSQTNDGMAKIVDAHTQALQAAMDHVGPFQSTRFGGQQNTNQHQGGGGGDDQGENDTDHLVPCKQSLCQWHGILYSYASSSGQQATKEASKAHAKKPPSVARLPTPTSFRTGGARAGSTHFCPPREIEDEFQRFRRGMIEICCQWENLVLPMPERMMAPSNSTPRSSNTSTVEETGESTCKMSPQHNSIYFSVGLAAMLLYGILNIHLFSDGNGRLARIGTNWMLKRTLGLPFTIAIAVNPQQRRQYIEALQKGHAAVNEALQNHQKKKKSKAGAKQQAFPKIGILEPLTRLLLDRIASAVRECQRNLDEKYRASMVAEGDRLARIARERMASGACIICLDDNPNIATLCCGQGVHLNCVAEWLANNSTCVYCRKPFQSLQLQRPPPPPRRPAAVAAPVVAGAAGQARVLEQLGRNATAIASTASIPAATRMRFQNQDLRSYLMGIHGTLQRIARGEIGIENRQRNAETTTEDTTSFETTAEDNDEGDTTTHDTTTEGTTSFETTTEDNDEDDTTTHDTTIDETTTNGVDEDETSTAETTTLDHDETETTTQDTSTNDVDEDETSTHDTTNHDTTADETTTHDVDESTTNESTNETTDGSSDDVTTSNAQHHASRCARCHNRAAMDCANDMCGRCCVLLGDYQCHRHGIL